eukprot:UN24217
MRKNFQQRLLFPEMCGNHFLTEMLHNLRKAYDHQIILKDPPLSF